MKKKHFIYVAALVVVATSLFAGGYWVMKQRAEASCSICARHINKRARVVVEIGGRRRVVCCAHCARTEGQQENKPVRFIEVTDYPTGKGFNPEEAWFVDGSRVMACDHKMAMPDEMKHTQEAVFDRCSPGTFAFRDRKAADAFVAENGGAVLRLAEFMREGQPK
jgi:hypothetical protein